MHKVSVVIPAYNVAAFIEDAVNSVLRQTFEDFELIIVDDGSTDDTAAICKACSDPRVRLVAQANRGLAGARNTGIRAAKGEFVAFLDADDLWHPTKLAKHVAYLEQNPDIGVSYSASQFMDDAGQLMSLYQTPRLKNVAAQDVFCRNPVGNGSAPVIRMAALRDIEVTLTRYGQPEAEYFDADFRQSEDIECWTRIAATTSWRFEGIGDALTLYRLNSGGLSASISKQLASWEAFYDKASRYAPELVSHWGRLARAYQYRYLARRALRSREPALAAKLLRRALRANWKIIVFEPARTIATLGAVALQGILPAGVYEFIEKTAMQTRNLSRA